MIHFFKFHASRSVLPSMQVNRGNELNALAGLKDQCKSVQVTSTHNHCAFTL